MTVKSDHLTVLPAGIGPPEEHFQFERREKRIGGALVVSIVTHLALALAVILFIRFAPERVVTAVLPDRLPDSIVWLSQPGPGGGGGGGNQSPEPPRKAEAPGKDKITVPVVKEPEPVAEVEKPPEEPPELPQLNIPAKSMAADMTAAVPGIIDSNANQAG